MIKTCPVCKKQFECTGNEKCWCNRIKVSKEFAALIAKKYPEQCLCKNCLENELISIDDGIALLKKYGLREIKKEIRIVAWDDCHFQKSHRGKVLVVGPIFRGSRYMDGMLSTLVTKDGNDSTKQIAMAIRRSRNYDQLGIIMLDGITFAGFNVINIEKLAKETELPVIVVQRRLPDIKRFTTALKIFHDYKERIKNAEAAGEFFEYGVKNKMFYQKYGINRHDTEKILEITCIRSNIPEPLRIAHIIASGLGGESSGRA